MSEPFESPAHASAPAESPAPVPGYDSFAHFVVLKTEDGQLDCIGKGGMGSTYRAIDTQLERIVALKVINSHYVHDAEARSRFVREARAAARLQHPNIASVLFQGVEGETCFYTMELVAGEDLQTYIGRVGPIGPVHALRMAHQIALALDAAGREGVLHRDLKPGNVMLTSYHEGEAPHLKVIDFGLAKLISDTPSTFVTGGFIGTPEFASPEQCQEEVLDARSDIYSLGVTLWFLLTGDVPYSGTALRVMWAHTSEPLPIEQLTSAPQPLIALLQRLMAKDRDHRPSTALEAAREIDATLQILASDRRNFDPLPGTSSDPNELRSAASPERYAGTGRNWARATAFTAGALLVLAGIGWALVEFKRQSPPAVSVASNPSPSQEVQSANPRKEAGNATPDPEPSATPITPAESQLAAPTPAPSPVAEPVASRAPELALEPTSPLADPTPEPTVQPTPASEPVAEFTPAPQPSVEPTPGLQVANPPAPVPQPAVAKNEPSPPSGTAFTNGIGMRFSLVPTIPARVSVWETRVADFNAFVEATGYQTSAERTSMRQTWKAPGFPQADDHPVVCVSYKDALAFCEWLTRTDRATGRIRETQTYKLLHRPDWDRASGRTPGEGFGGPPEPNRGSRPRPGSQRPGQQPRGSAPASERPFYWGTQSWPPPDRTANIAGSEAFSRGSARTYIMSYKDEFAYTAPVGSYPANRNGIYDLIGNAAEIISDGPPEQPWYGYCGASWASSDKNDFLAFGITNFEKEVTSNQIGFRIALYGE